MLDCCPLFNGDFELGVVCFALRTLFIFEPLELDSFEGI